MAPPQKEIARLLNGLFSLLAFSAGGQILVVGEDATTLSTRRTGAALESNSEYGPPGMFP